jgi:tetratricopeptide (TPR) repeat protein
MKPAVLLIPILAGTIQMADFPYQTKISQGIEYYFQENFTKAEEVFLGLIQADTLNPAGYYFLALTYQGEMLDLESDYREEEFYATLEKSIRMSERRLEKDKKDKLAHFYLGNSYGNWGLYQARQGSWFSALRSGFRAKANWERVLELDSTFYEAYAGLGSYFYWKSAYTKKFRWLPFVKDKRQEGIGMLKLAAENSVLSKEFALSSLMWINLREKNYPQALNLAYYFQSKYPQAKFPLWAEGFIYYEKFDWKNALQTFDKLMQRLQETQPSNFYNLIEVEFRMANCHYNLGKYKEARQLGEKILTYPLDKKTQHRQREKLKKAKELLEKITKRQK